MFNKNNIALHFIVWISYIVLPLFILPDNIFENKINFFIESYFILSLFSVIFFYINYSFLVSKYLLKKKYLAFILFNLLFIIPSFILLKLILVFGTSSENYYELSQTRFYLGSFLKFLVIFIIAIGLKLSRKLKQVEIEKTKTELQALKAQINPHFLFNTLNGIYGQAILKSDETAESISKLSSMMRYVLTETEEKFVLLSDEINYLEDYINLQKIRITDKTNVNFSLPKHIDGIHVPPLLFISFIENAFKYGVDTEKESIINIQFRIEKNEVVLEVKNTKNNKSSLEISNNIGLSNTKKRLDLIFGSNYLLNITETTEDFKVILKIPIK